MSSLSNIKKLMEESVKERLLVAGIREVELHGLNDFSLRRVAASCDLSCAAPYRHFKSKEDLICEILKYINSRWHMLLSAIREEHSDSEKDLLIESAVGYVRFLIVTPSYLSILFHSSPAEESEGSALSLPDGEIKKMAASYAESVGASEECRDRLAYAVRALIYGSIVLIKLSQGKDTEDVITSMREKLCEEISNLDGK